MSLIKPFILKQLSPLGAIGLGAGTQDNKMPDAVRQYMADPRYSDPFADLIR